MSNHIKIFLRVRPSKRFFGGLVLDDENNSVQVHLNRRERNQYVNNIREDYDFKFDGLLNTQAKQDQVFNVIAKDTIDSVMQGFNGTIFAYGQTGSGKTFTITGGAERYVDRGLIPRTLTYIFQEIKRKTDTNYKISVSYLEIYNEQGYDLLDESQYTRNLQDLPKVIHREDGNGNIQLYNLSVHRADSEEDALNLLFIGDNNRVIAETPSNDASTRSHCIFIIQIEAQKLGSDVKTVSKLHLVDLAGSERVGKTGVDGVLLQEARFINTSLHFLEQVIVCLQKKSQGEQMHIPYRNSFMTLILRDSLGGNCKTNMIATISPDDGDMEESVSTCRFAQRVACIKNTAKKNEELDPQLIIQRLKQEVQELKAENKLLKGGEESEHLTAEESEQCRQIVEEFINSRDPSSKILLSSMMKINECFYHFKQMYNQLRAKGGGGASSSSGNSRPMDSTTQEEIQRLHLLVQQRDNEIAILLNHVNRKGDNGSPSRMSTSTGFQTLAPTEEIKAPPSPAKIEQAVRMQQQRNTLDQQRQLAAPTNISITAEQLQDRNQAFDIFRRSYRKNQAQEDNKRLLKERIDRAKYLTEIINSSRNSINGLKNQIEQLRRENAVQGLVDSDNVPLEHPREESFRNQLEQYKMQYRDGVTELRNLKSEIEGIQKMLEQSRKRMQNDFEQWLQVMVNQKRGPSRGGDETVQQNLQEFYKARDEIYNSFNNQANDFDQSGIVDVHN